MKFLELAEKHPNENVNALKPRKYSGGEYRAVAETISFKVTMIQAKQLFGYEDDTPL